MFNFHAGCVCSVHPACRPLLWRLGLRRGNRCRRYRRSDRLRIRNAPGRGGGEGDCHMPLKSWKKLSEATMFRNPYWTYKRDTFELPSGKPGEYHYVHTNGSSMVVPIVVDGSMLLVNQYRCLVGRESMEFPCGSGKG